jgi:hypothetical protein
MTIFTIVINYARVVQLGVTCDRSVGILRLSSISFQSQKYALALPLPQNERWENAESCRKRFTNCAYQILRVKFLFVAHEM